MFPYGGAALAFNQKKSAELHHIRTSGLGQPSNEYMSLRL